MPPKIHIICSSLVAALTLCAASTLHLLEAPLQPYPLLTSLILTGATVSSTSLLILLLQYKQLLEQLQNNSPKQQNNHNHHNPLLNCSANKHHSQQRTQKNTAQPSGTPTTARFEHKRPIEKHSPDSNNSPIDHNATAHKDTTESARKQTLTPPCQSTPDFTSAERPIKANQTEQRSHSALDSQRQEQQPTLARNRLDAREEQRRVQRLQRLQREIELLAVMRDLSLIANDGSEIQPALEKAFEFIHQLWDASEIQIFVQQDQEIQLTARYQRKMKTPLFATREQPIRFPGEIKTATQIIQQLRSIYRLNSQRLLAAVPLLSDHKAIGVIVVFVPTRSRGHSWARETLAELTEISKHVSLVVQKPSLYDRAVLDKLTGLFSKRHFLEQVPRDMGAARRLKQGLSLIVIDIDHFKKINDNHGHVTGDIVLANVAQTISQQIREYDTAYRFGGEEICIVAPNTELAEALSLAERIRKTLEQQSITGDKQQIVPVTASLGVASFKKSMDSIDSFLAVADQQLYKAKQNGRNQVQPRPTPPKKTLKHKKRSIKHRSKRVRRSRSEHSLHKQL